MRRGIAAAVLALALGSAAPAEAIRDSAFIGQISLVASTYCPTNAVPADGRLLPINENQVLFSLIGNNYGGDQDKGTFALPDLSGRTPAPDLLYCIALYGIYPGK